MIALHAWNDLLQVVALGGVEAASVAGWFPIAKVGVALLMGLYGLFLLRGQDARVDGEFVPAAASGAARAAA